jgi:putative ABC transport system permease protein
VKYLHLVVANLKRHKLRTALTILSVVLALFLFASLRTVVTTLDANSQFGGARRLVSTNKTGIVFILPISYANKIKGLKGVRSVSWANWFGGQYGVNPRDFFPKFAVDPESYLAMYPELQMPQDQKEAFLRERTAVIVGQRLADRWGWKLGQDITIKGTIFPGDWTFTIRGIYTPTDPAIGDNVMFFHHEYFDERIGHAGIVGWFIVEIENANDAAMVAKEIDDQFRNSSAATKTGTEKEFQAGFATMLGNVSLLMGMIGTAVVFAILLITANAMMMSASERTGEVAVMKTIGFPNRTIFTLVLVESGLITVVGAAIGLGLAKGFYPLVKFNGFGFLPGFTVTSMTMMWGALLALALMLASGLVPAVRAARLPIVQALRRVE